MVQLVEELLGGRVNLGVGLAHGLVEGLVVVNGGLEARDVGAVVAASVGRRGRLNVAGRAPFGDVLSVLLSL